MQNYNIWKSRSPLNNIQKLTTPPVHALLYKHMVKSPEPACRIQYFCATNIEVVMRQTNTKAKNMSYFLHGKLICQSLRKFPCNPPHCLHCCLAQLILNPANVHFIIIRNRNLASNIFIAIFNISFHSLFPQRVVQFCYTPLNYSQKSKVDLSKSMSNMDLNGPFFFLNFFWGLFYKLTMFESLRWIKFIFGDLLIYY